MLRIDRSNLVFGVASKTAPISVKPLRQIIPDSRVLGLLTMRTTEGPQALAEAPEGVVVCMGLAHDFWQQSREKVEKQYDVGVADDEGWAAAVPKPENARNFTLVPKAVGEFILDAQWGTEDPESVTGFSQRGVGGDFIFQSQEDPTDYWIVSRKTFNNTYEVVTPPPGRGRI